MQNTTTEPVKYKSLDDLKRNLKNEQPVKYTSLKDLKIKLNNEQSIDDNKTEKEGNDKKIDKKTKKEGNDKKTKKEGSDKKTDSESVHITPFFRQEFIVEGVPDVRELLAEYLHPNPDVSRKFVKALATLIEGHEKLDEEIGILFSNFLRRRLARIKDKGTKYAKHLHRKLKSLCAEYKDGATATDTEAVDPHINDDDSAFNTDDDDDDDETPAASGGVIQLLHLV